MELNGQEPGTSPHFEVSCHFFSGAGMHQSPTFKSSIRLYGLTRRNSDGQYQEVSCTTTFNGISAVRAFVSRLDAELAAQNSDLEAQPLSQFFYPGPLAEQQSGLNLHICLGFAAQNDQLLIQNKQLVPMGWFTYIDVRNWGRDYYLNWGDELPRKLGNVYGLLKLPDYNTFLNELDVAHPKEMFWHKTEALGAMSTRVAESSNWDQISLFDPVNCCWCFGSTAGSYQTHIN